MSSVTLVASAAAATTGFMSERSMLPSTRRVTFFCSGWMGLAEEADGLGEDAGGVDRVPPGEGAQACDKAATKANPTTRACVRNRAGGLTRVILSTARP